MKKDGFKREGLHVKKGFAPPQSHSHGASVAGSLLPFLALWGIAS